MRSFPFRIIPIDGTTVEYVFLPIDDDVHFAAKVHLCNSNTVTMVFLRYATEKIGK